MATDPRRVKELFVAALDLPDVQARRALLDRECGGDADLRDRLDVLLQAHDDPASVLDRPLAEVAPVGPGGTGGGSSLTVPAVDAPSPPESAGMLIAGRYELAEQVGEGGMGTVWMAQQTEPVKRLVAVKLIKAGMSSKAVLARFEAERQALALMDYPNIAKVFDAGAMGEPGRPFFVMELVKGVPITKYCDEHRLSPRERLELFVPVCQAIQHAHQKGIIHRDVKPSNVLIALYDDRPVPKVIDFGVAKATGRQLTEETLDTGFGAVVGTIEYMSPEQASLNQLDVDTRSDVYALGVLLYELLAGGPPFGRKELEGAGVLEMLRVIREQEPTKPSTKLSTADGLPTLAANRGTEPRRLAALVRGELDWIVMKALEKDRRRYETANGLALDVQRYLNDEPVSAGPPSAAYRLRKFVRRNKGPVLAATLVLLVLIGGIAGTTWGLVRAERAWQAEAQRAEGESQAKQEAEAREAETQKVLEFVENRVFAAARPEGQKGGLGHDVTLRKAIEAALPFVEKKFADQPLIEARVRMSLGLSFEYLGEAKRAEEQYQKARAIRTKHLGPDHPDTLKSVIALAVSYSDQRRYAEALKLEEETLALCKTKLAPGHPSTLACMNNLAVSYSHLGRHADAMRLFDELLALEGDEPNPEHFFSPARMCNLAGHYRRLGQYDDAIKLYAQALLIGKARNPDHPFVWKCMYNLATCYSGIGRHGEALKLREETLALAKAKLGPDDRRTLSSMYALVNSYADLGRHAEALKLCEQTLALQKAKLGPDDPDTLWSMMALANSYQALGRHAEALKLREQTLALQKAKLGPDHPDTLDSMHNLVGSYLHLGRYGEAAKLAKQTLALRKVKLRRLGTALYRAGDWKDAIANLEKAIGLRRTDDPDNAYEGFFLAMAHWQLGEKDKAREWFDKSVQWMEKDGKANEELRRFRAEAADLLGIKERPTPKPPEVPLRKR